MAATCVEWRTGKEVTKPWPGRLLAKEQCSRAEKRESRMSGQVGCDKLSVLGLLVDLQLVDDAVDAGFQGCLAYD